MLWFLHNMHVKFGTHNLYAYLEVTLNLKTDKFITGKEWNISLDAYLLSIWKIKYARFISSRML
jgi:hypothetical protein